MSDELSKSDAEIETSDEEVINGGEDKEAQKTEEETSGETHLEKESSQNETKSKEEKLEKLKEEYDKRLNGMMSSWQSDRTEKLKLEQKIEEMEKKTKETSDEEEKTVEYYAEKIAEKQRKKAETEKQKADSEIQFVISSMQSKYSDFDHKKVIPIINEYYDEGDLENVDKLTSTFEKGYKLFKKLQEQKIIEGKKIKDDIKRKKEAGNIGGKSASEKGGLKSFDAQQDKGKSYAQLLKEGFKEYET